MIKWWKRGTKANSWASGSIVPGNDEFEKELYVMQTVQTYRDAVTALVHDDSEEAERLLNQYTKTHQDQGENPFEHLARAGLMVNAWHLRMMMGDDNPAGHPQGTMGTSVLTFDQGTGELVELPEEEFAIGAITHAANWDWPKLDSTMKTRCDEANKAGDEKFLMRFVSIMINIFIALDGPKHVGWVK